MSKLGEVGSQSLVKRKEREVGALLRAMREEGEASSPWQAMAGDDLGLMRSSRLNTVERILNLKREMKVLRARRRFYNGGTVGKEEAQPVTAREEEAQPAGAEKKRKKVVVKRRLVPQELIDYMIENPHDPWNGYPQEQLANRSQKFLEYYAREKAYQDKFLEYQQALIKQYRDNGFAEDYMEMEVSNNEDKT